MEICKTDVNSIIRLLSDAAVFYRTHAKSTREIDRIRLLQKMSNKLNRKQKDDKKRIGYANVEPNKNAIKV